MRRCSGPPGERVVSQGDRRPIDDHPHAREALRQLVTRRQPLYARAEVTVDTAGLSPARTLARVISALAG